MKRFFLFLLVAACGPNPIDDIVEGEGGVIGVDATLPRDAAFPDVTFDAPVDATKFNGGGPFLCHGCVCDGTLDLCYFGGGGGGAPIANDAGDDADASPFGDAGACSLDASSDDWACMQIPVQCLPNPTCDCIGQASPCSCSVDPSGSGFVITCPPKP